MEPKKSVLIVEDDEVISRMYQKLLENNGYESLTASDGITGLDSAILNKPNLILLDIKMPKMNGIEMLKELRKNPWGKDVPVIILTNLESNEEMVWDIAETQPSYYLLKVENRPETVLDKIKEVLNKNG